MEQWIVSNLPMEHHPDGDVVVLETHKNGGRVIIPVTVLASMLAVSAPPTHAALSSLPIASAGWQSYFDGWKAQGIIS